MQNFAVYNYFPIVGPPNVEVSTNQSGILYAGTSLTFSCIVTLDSDLVDSDENVTITWSGSRSISGERYLLIGASGSQDMTESSGEQYSSINTSVSGDMDTTSDSENCMEDNGNYSINGSGEKTLSNHSVTDSENQSSGHVYSGSLSHYYSASGSGDSAGSQASGSDESYIGILIISPLAEKDDGKYTCSVTVSGGDNTLDAISIENISINVSGNKLHCSQHVAYSYTDKVCLNNYNFVIPF